MRKPDFSRMRKTLLLEGEPDFVPMFNGVDRELKSAFLGKPVTDLKNEVEFAIAAGYDFVHLWVGLPFIMGWGGRVFSHKTIDMKKPIFETHRDKYSAIGENEGDRTWLRASSGNITTLEEFESFPWPSAEDFDFSAFEEIKQYLPPDMKAIVTLSGVYDPVWWLMGGESFYLASVDNPELISKMFEKVGELHFKWAEKALSFDHVGALRIDDDIAYNNGTLVSPKFLRQYFIPWFEKVGKLVKSHGLPFLYHSDGNLYEILDDLIAAGLNALHPIQPNAMDIRYLKQKVGDKLCLMGNIDMDVLSRGTPDEVAELVKRNLRDIAPGGGYVVGASNSIPEYIPFNNYNAMRKTALEYGHYPISV